MQVDKVQFEKILSYIDIGIKGGATLLTGGKPWGSKGYYVEPTVFVDVKVCSCHFWITERRIFISHETNHTADADRH